ncbi:unnamed protein product [Ambrosiozyma monospora]|uniref:Unnamed protein product n=1 Tax=Ambrosiozyma monospora TaxID=43982 RepID=A0ACB5T4H0_AMBMO|nr:unnamed protein product [Ambrosiozyma monospora]
MPQMPSRTPQNEQQPRFCEKDDEEKGLRQCPYPARTATSFISQTTILLVLSVCGLSLLGLIAFSFMTPTEGADLSTCRGVYMSPAYARVHGFDETHTRFASKYSLYLYKEQGKEAIPNDSHALKLTGAPVLFIPGNAGSFKQVRSIASAAANWFHDNGGYIEYLNPNANNLDFFSADFNEDFTAFHGRTMLDQAEYLNEAIAFILSLYSQNEIPVTSVILVGHSMGGMVSRVMLSLPNYVEGSVNTILTLAAPHAAAPATFDGDILSVQIQITKRHFGVNNRWIVGPYGSNRLHRFDGVGA